ncbi:sugar ABC transporter ATP-binding protein [Arthrobacter globiformis]|uniref:sugar ABC transporter ATP-binding protein n=1 Tax=Arthrobacter globiformis TaxID=1665 RepID=UPI00277D81F0|nr:sugar ABC transporter ATP-binding protein [Arthrobacter globiformis]MDQ0864613.1 ribose transport system ATP-binding protein [Arthrobacter globiformis]
MTPDHDQGRPDVAYGLQLSGIQKSFGTNHVLRGIEMNVPAGTVHALLGANGAGKSTLLGCLSGATQPDAGEIVIGGRSYQGLTPTRAFKAGCAIIYQHFQLIGSLTVADNIFLGQELRNAMGGVDTRGQERAAASILDSLDVEISPRTLVGSLSVGEQQIVEIARALRRKPDLLILDEPTAALGPHEVAALIRLVRRLAETRGLTVIYVTHLLNEVLQVADAVTVLRDGQVHWTRDRQDLGLKDLVDGISPGSSLSKVKGARTRGEPLLRLTEFQCSFTGPFTTTVHAGEIVGVFGLLGSGRTNLLESLAGVRRATGGSVRLSGRTLDTASVAKASKGGVSLVAADRKVQSLFGSMTAEENVLLPHYGQLSNGFRSRARERAAFTGIAKRIKLSPQAPGTAADSFSGGNAQKLVVGRWTADLGKTSVLLLDEPTQGVDIGSRHEIYDLLRDFASHASRCVIFASSEPEELLALADRVFILVDGVPTEIPAQDITENYLLSAAHGSFDGVEGKSK